MGWLMQDQSAKCCSCMLVMECDVWLNCCVSYIEYFSVCYKCFCRTVCSLAMLIQNMFHGKCVAKSFIKYSPCQDCRIKWTVYRVEGKYWMTDLVGSKIWKHCDFLTEVGCQNSQHTAQENLKMCLYKIETLNKAFLKNWKQVLLMVATTYSQWNCCLSQTQHGLL
jgi:hypothetical protein